MRRSAAALLIAATTLAGCGGDDETGSSGSTETAATPPADAAEQRHPDVIAAEATLSGDGTWSFAVTISSPYDTPDRYADGWRVLGPDGEVYGEHMLMHDHAGEQPFTRTQRGVEVPSGVDEVTIEGRDQRYGYGGATVTITLVR